MLLLLSVLGIALVSFDASGAAAVKKKNTRKGVGTDTVAKKVEPKKGSIAAVLKDGAKYQKGLFTVVEQEGRFYFLMPKTIFGRDLLLVNRMSQGAAGVRSGFTGYAGDEIQESMIRFQLSPDTKSVFIESIMTRELPRDSTGDMFDNVMKSNLQPLAVAFEVKGASTAKDTVLIDVTDFFGGDSELAAFDGWVKNSLSIHSFQRDKSYIVGVQSFPTNTEIKSIKSYNYQRSGSFEGRPIPAKPVTFEINTSIIALPEIPMQPRYADNRVGYFTERYVDFDKNPQGVKDIELITRWRLEPKPEDVEKYKAGELVEPAEPIIYYIDPSTPKKWIPYLMQGVNDWEPVFRKAGFKNAIKAMEAPVGDSTWSLDDARHSAIVYKPSTIPNAMGPHVHDPRTGQILESHIYWYHNVMLLLRNWYMLQAGPNDKRAQQLVFPEDLMGELVRFVSSHEVGHTLGLRHNFGSTSLTPVDSLRSRTFLKSHGHTPSIMDYSRFNYVVQPEDGIDPQLQYPRIGEYDEWAIEWGYRRFVDLTTADAERTKLNEWIIEASKNPRLWFGHEANCDDPRSQAEDLGDNQMKANELGIKNLKRVIAGLPSWTKSPNGGYRDMSEIYMEVLGQYLRYVGHVSKWVGGIYENPRTQEQGADVYSYVSKEKQKEAMRWLAKYWITTPEWLLNEQIFQSTGEKAIDVVGFIYNRGFSNLLNQRVLKNLLSAQAALGASKAFTIADYFAALNPAILVANPNINQRIVQKIYVDRLLSFMDIEPGSSAVNSDMTSVVMAQLRSIQARFASLSTQDPTVAAHYNYLVHRIKDTLDKK